MLQRKTLSTYLIYYTLKSGNAYLNSVSGRLYFTLQKCVSIYFLNIFKWHMSREKRIGIMLIVNLLGHPENSAICFCWDNVKIMNGTGKYEQIY